MRDGARRPHRSARLRGSAGSAIDSIARALSLRGGCAALLAGIALACLPEGTNTRCPDAAAVDQLPFVDRILPPPTPDGPYLPLSCVDIPDGVFLDHGGRLPPGGSGEPGTPYAASAAWYRLEVPRSGRLCAQTCGSRYDTVLLAFRGSCSDPVELACNDDACGLQSVVEVDAVGGETLFFAVGNFPTVPPSDLRLVLAYAADDTDGDGVADCSDVCPAAFDPEQLDLDFDLTGDACEDNDGDGFLDSVDTCPLQSDPAQADRDGDGVGDLCDNCLDVPNGPLASIRPGDVQADTDRDRIGDACDLDFDQDNRISISDFFRVLRPCMGSDVGEEPECAEADLDGDGTVGPADFFARFRPAVGTSPGPSALAPHGPYGFVDPYGNPHLDENGQPYSIFYPDLPPDLIPPYDWRTPPAAPYGIRIGYGGATLFGRRSGGYSLAALMLLALLGGGRRRHR